MLAGFYRSPLLIAYGNFIFHYRNRAFPLALLSVLILFPPARDGGVDLSDQIKDSAALVLGLAGEAIRILTVGLEYIKRGGLNRQVYADKLVVNGLFAHCRNPLYVGNVMIAFALLLLFDRLAILVVGGVMMMLTYVAIIAAEERFLRERFGAEFEDYCRRANRWLPDFRRLGTTIASMNFNWKRVFLKESSSFFGWVTMAFLIDGAEVVGYSWPLRDNEFIACAALFVCVAVMFLIIRILKKSKLLRLDTNPAAHPSEA